MSDRFSFALATFGARSFWKKCGAVRCRLAKDVEFSVAYQPVLGIGLDEFPHRKRHRTIVRELGCEPCGVLLEEVPMLSACKAIALLIPYILGVRQTGGPLCPE